MQRAHTAKPLAPSVRPIQWQVFACAALCAAGATLGLLNVLGEIRYHLAWPGRGLGYASAALCAGIILGLWMPRRIIRRRLARGPSGARQTLSTSPTHADGLRVEFAASLSGTLIVTFALTWLALCGGGLFMEEYRAWLAARFLHPAQVKHLLLLLPACIGLALAGATGTTLLAALHGWYRLVTQPNTNVTRLWVCILLGALSAGLLAGEVGSAGATSWLAPLTVFLAAVIAVARRSDAVAAPTLQPTQRRPTRAESLYLLAAALAAGTTGTALFLTIPQAWVTWQTLALAVVVLAATAVAGLCAARVLLRLGLSGDLGLFALLLAGTTLLLPYQRILAPSVDVALVRLGVVSASAAACIVLIGRRINQTSHSMQYALAWVGGFVTAGFGLTLALLPVSAARWNSSTVVVIVAFVATAGAGLALILDGRAKTPTRVAGLIVIGVWLPVTPSATHDLVQTLRPQEPACESAVADPLTSAARRLLTADPLGAARLPPLPPAASNLSAWQFDLTGPPVDIVILERVAAADDRLLADSELGRRLLKRAMTRLARGGRLLIELPTAPFVAAAIDNFDPTATEPAWAAYRLRISDEKGQYEALVFGGDIPALVRRHATQPGLTVSLQPLRASVDAER